jgi:hypothetical protein
MDGVIELRRGVEDLDMGNSKYAQVRIGVDDTHYLKVMAIYSNDIPEGYDIVFVARNTINGAGMEEVRRSMYGAIRACGLLKDKN